jgi:transcriptional regulator with XRE-family HTH domain
MIYTQMIRVYINKSGITQAEFAKRVGLNKRRVCDWLLNRKNPTSDDVEKLKVFFESKEIKTITE